MNKSFFTILVLIIPLFSIFSGGEPDVDKASLQLNVIGRTAGRTDSVFAMKAGEGHSLYITHGIDLLKYEAGEFQSGTKPRLLASGVSCFDVEGNYILAGKPNGLIISRDGGLTWDFKTRKDRIAGIPVCVSVEENLMLVGTEMGLSLSIDGGISWRIVSYQDGLSTARVEMTAILDGILYVLADSTIYISRNRGEGWETQSADLNGLGHIIKITTIKGNLALMGDRSYTIWDGISWKSQTDSYGADRFLGIDDFAQYSIRSWGNEVNGPAPFLTMELLPSDKSDEEIISYSTERYKRAAQARVRNFSGERWFVADYYGILYSDDLGENWVECLSSENPQFVSVNEQTLLTHTNQGLFKSVDYGETWKQLTVPEMDCCYDIILFHNILFLSSDKGIYTSLDETHWDLTEFPSIRQNDGGNFVAKGDLLLCETKRGLLYTDDLGFSWSSTVDQGESVSLNVRSSAIEGGRIALLGGKTVVNFRESGAFSFNYGDNSYWCCYIKEEAMQKTPESWTADDMQPVTFELAEKLESSYDEHYREGGTFDGLSFSLDGGETWTRKDIEEITGYDAVPSSFWEDGGQLYLSFSNVNKSNLGALWVSSDWGQSWEKSSHPLAEEFIELSGETAGVKWAVSDSKTYKSSGGLWTPATNKMRGVPLLGDVTMMASDDKYCWFYFTARSGADREKGFQRFDKVNRTWQYIPFFQQEVPTYFAHNTQTLNYNGDFGVAGQGALSLYRDTSHTWEIFPEACMKEKSESLMVSGQRIYQLTPGDLTYTDDLGQSYNSVVVDQSDLSLWTGRPDGDGGLIIKDGDNSFHFVSNNETKSLSLEDYDKEELWIFDFMIFESHLYIYGADESRAVLLTYSLNNEKGSLENRVEIIGSMTFGKILDVEGNSIALSTGSRDESFLYLSQDNGAHWDIQSSMGSIPLVSVDVLEIVDKRLVAAFLGEVAPGINFALACSDDFGKSWQTATSLDYMNIPSLGFWNTYALWGDVISDDEGRIIYMDRWKAVEAVWK